MNLADWRGSRFPELPYCGHLGRSFETLRAYDEADYRFLERERRLESTSYTGKPYRGSLLFHDARVSIDGRLVPVCLSMAAGYIYARLCDGSGSQLEKCTPYRYVPGRYHNRIEGKYRRWDMRVHAGGREAIVEELQRRIWRYEEERLEILLTRWDSESHSCVYFVNEPGDTIGTTHIVFSDKIALEKVRFTSFIKDCRSIERPCHALEYAAKEEKALLERFIEAKCVEVTRGYDPKVARMPEQYRVPIRAP